jgi:hypothetical protein
VLISFVGHKFWLLVPGIASNQTLMAMEYPHIFHTPGGDLLWYRWPIIDAQHDDCPIEHGDFPVRYVKLPKGNIGPSCSLRCQTLNSGSDK